MTEIIALSVAADGGALVAVWPTRTCGGCRREAALGVIRLGTTEPRRNEFKCCDCDEFGVGARLLPEGPSASPQAGHGGPRAASSHKETAR